MNVLVLYHSQEYGDTGAMAEAVAEGARHAGAAVISFNTDEGRYDAEAFRDVKAVAFGTPDYHSHIAGGLKVFLDDWYIAKQADPVGLTDKHYGLFYSHGGGGVRQPFEKLFTRFGSQVGQTVEARDAPDEEALAACRQLGEQLARVAGV